MASTFFILLIFIAGLVRGPMSLLVIFLKNFSKSLKLRVDFERKNFFQNECRSFKRDNLVADYCFEVSSEGELEQVKPLIEYYLFHKKLIEILFASPSVENKCLKLAKDYKNQLRVMRLPIASFAPVTFLFFQSPWSWVSAPIIIFCRYDFYPELLSFKFFKKKLILLSAAGKNPSWFKRQSVSLFSLIVAANETEAKYFKKIVVNQPVLSFDFRVTRIFERKESSLLNLESVDELSTYLTFLDSQASSQKIVMGSAWESDLGILKNWTTEILAGSKHFLLVPHNLSLAAINQILRSLDSCLPKVPVYEIKKGQIFDATILDRKPGIVILNLSGILCELYSKFSMAYVGGGYERSIHSVLEPFVSGCQVFCGPKISRSTEFDFIRDIAPDEIHLLNTPESFYNLVRENELKIPDPLVRSNLLKNARSSMEIIIKEIELC